VLKYMLDTNMVIYTIKNRPGQVREAFKKHEGQMCISSVTWGELIYGTEKSSQPERNLADIEGLVARLEILDFGDQAAVHFGQLRVELYRQGKPIGPYDMMIAGHARSMGLILVTNNLKEFERVPGLRLENWVENTVLHICPECDHQFSGGTWGGIDAHWRAHHENIMPYEEAWPLIVAGNYERVPK